MKFDFIIGNPPYQEEQGGDNKTFAPPIYHKFMDESYKLSDNVELIHPARFLFNAGSTPKDWNAKMLNDPHYKIIYYEKDGSKIFPGTDIKGGVAISYRNSKKDYGAIISFAPFDELTGISEKAGADNEEKSLSNIIYTQNRFDLDELYKDYPKFKKIIGSDGRDKRFRNNIFEKVNIFTDKQIEESDIRVLGVIKNNRIWKYIIRKYVDTSHENLFSYKVIVPRANGTGSFGEVLSMPIVLKPGEGYTQTFIGIGSFKTEDEANNLLKYIKSRFCRTMLGLLKIDQHNEKDTWRRIPIQDFSFSSDIDWTKSITEIDQQLYKKYGLDNKEIEFIESHVKEME